MKSVDRKWMIGFLVAITASGCESYSCTEEARYAVNIEVRDADGALVTPDEVEYTVDGGDPILVDCTSGIEPCSDGHVSIGAELEGAYEIVVRRGDASAEASVVVTADRCHVMPEQLTVTLSP